ncbi:reverse transcriptase domain-containing protein [Tanacetum coccineum]
MAESDEEKTAFHTSQGVYCYTKMPFGLKNAGATYQRLVDKAFDSQVGQNMEVYVDDLVIKSHTEAEMLRDIDETFRTFLSKSAEMSLPLFKTLKRCIKKSEFHWTPEAEQAFKQLKQHLSELPLLVAPKPKEELIMYLSTSYDTISAVLMTERGTVQTPVYFVSRALQGHELNYTPMEKLFLSLVFAAKRLRSVMLGEHNITYRPRTSVKGQILADFLVEKPDENPPDTPVVEAPQEPWTLFTDGSSCVDGSGAGLILTSPEGVEFTYALRFQFTASNNEAEYEALIASLQIAAQMGVRNVHVSVDSKLVANQVLGTYVAKEENMIKYLEKVKSLVLVEILKDKSIQEEEVATVVEEEGATWMTPIMEYLKDGTLPGDRKEASKLLIKARQYELMEGILYRRSFLKPWLSAEMIQSAYDCLNHTSSSCQDNPHQAISPIHDPVGRSTNGEFVWLVFPGRELVKVKFLIVEYGLITRNGLERIAGDNHRIIGENFVWVPRFSGFCYDTSLEGSKYRKFSVVREFADVFFPAEIPGLLRLERLNLALSLIHGVNLFNRSVIALICTFELVRSYGGSYRRCWRMAVIRTQCFAVGLVRVREQDISKTAFSKAFWATTSSWYCPSVMTMLLTVYGVDELRISYGVTLLREFEAIEGDWCCSILTLTSGSMVFRFTRNGIEKSFGLCLDATIGKSALVVETIMLKVEDGSIPSTVLIDLTVLVWFVDRLCVPKDQEELKRHAQSSILLVRFEILETLLERFRIRLDLPQHYRRARCLSCISFFEEDTLSPLHVRSYLLIRFNVIVLLSDD